MFTVDISNTTWPSTYSQRRTEFTCVAVFVVPEPDYATPTFESTIDTHSVIITTHSYMHIDEVSEMLDEFTFETVNGGQYKLIPVF